MTAIDTVPHAIAPVSREKEPVSELIRICIKSTGKVKVIIKSVIKLIENG